VLFVYFALLNQKVFVVSADIVLRELASNLVELLLCNYSRFHVEDWCKVELGLLFQKEILLFGRMHNAL
jgi:hypothetical protein